MRTNVVIDDNVMKKAMSLSKLKTKRSVIEMALQEFVISRSMMDLSDLRGQVQFADDYDYKKLREGR